MLDLSSVKPLRDEPYPFTELQEKCLRDLETTEAPQGRWALESSKGFCCLGRFCVVAGVERMPTTALLSGMLAGELAIRYSYKGTESEGGYLPKSLTQEVGLRTNNGSLLQAVSIPGKGRFYSMTGMNDDTDQRRLTFKEIAQYLRHDPWNVFIDPAAIEGGANG